MQLKENLNFNKLINLPGQVTADEQSTQCVIFQVNIQTIQRILTGFQLAIFNHKQARSKSEIIKVDQRRKRYKSICKKRVSDTSSNSNKNEKCGGGKEEVDFHFTIDESCSAYSVIYTKMKLRN